MTSDDIQIFMIPCETGIISVISNVLKSELRLLLALQQKILDSANSEIKMTNHG